MHASDLKRMVRVIGNKQEQILYALFNKNIYFNRRQNMTLLITRLLNKHFRTSRHGCELHNSEQG